MASDVLVVAAAAADDRPALTPWDVGILMVGAGVEVDKTFSVDEDEGPAVDVFGSESSGIALGFVVLEARRAVDLGTVATGSLFPLVRLRR